MARKKRSEGLGSIPRTEDLTLAGRALEIERKRRASETWVDPGIAAALRGTLFSQQLAYVDDPSTQKACICPRQSGKTYSDVVYMLLEALEHPGVEVAFVTPVRGRSKDIVWNDPKTGLPALLRTHGIRAEVRESDLEVRFENGSWIKLYGIEDRGQADKLRGPHWRLVIVDEAGVWDSELLRYVIDEAAGPSLFKHGGTLVLSGTPGFVPDGLWFRVTEGVADEDGQVPDDWSVHRWLSEDNVFSPNAVEAVSKGLYPDVRTANRELLESFRLKRRYSVDSPFWRREYLAEWVRDDRETLFLYDQRKHSHLFDARKFFDDGYLFVLGVDIGFARDPTAVVAWAFSDSDPQVHEVSSFEVMTPSSDDIASVIQEQIAAFSPVAVAVDYAGGGGAIINAVQDRLGIDFVQPAQKGTTRLKHLATIEAVNCLLADGKVRVRRGSELEKQWIALRKNRKTGLQHPNQDDHCADAGRYGLLAVQDLWSYQAPRERQDPRRAYEDEVWRTVRERSIRSEAQSLLPWYERETQEQADHDPDPSW